MPMRPERRSFNFVLGAADGDAFKWWPPYVDGSGDPDPLGPDGALAAQFGIPQWSGFITGAQAQVTLDTLTSIDTIRVLVANAPIDGVYDPVDILAADPADLVYDSGEVAGPWSADGLILEQVVAAPGAAWSGPLAVAVVWTGTGTVGNAAVKVVLSTSEDQP